MGKVDNDVEIVFPYTYFLIDYGKNFEFELNFYIPAYLLSFYSY